VVRFFGVGASKLGMPFNNEEMQFDLSVSALGSYYGREIANIAGNVITLTTSYDPNPTTGLVVGDLMAAKSTDGTVNVNGLAITALTASTVTVSGTITGAAPGHFLVIRPNASLTLNTLTPFLWPLTQYKYGTTLAASASAAQTRLEPGTLIDIMHKFKSDNGEPRSGAFDPASLIRTTGMYDFKTKQYFDNPDQYKIFHAITKQAATIASTSGATNSLVANLNHFKIDKLGQPTQFGEVIYQDIQYGPQYDMPDGQGMSFVLTNGSVTM